ncbi:PREDICTED: coiled-coil domain-containing protein 6-like isoform X2 [Papilio polytes]|uniref:coiled-coil domain-containing protein 6-like isoform X2 n=1 Tax=Papilio polytes TaxID=76194 RepID=UPI000675D0A0|nr:PREDICTED: coiled-coil domain-containing protein 6-like isoform X2 [Papilio polytes]
MDDTVVSPGNKMGDSASESDSSSLDGVAMLPPSNVSRDQLQKRIESLQQQNRVLKVELDTYKLHVKALQEENRALRQASVSIQAKAEQEKEYISNTLLKKIQALKKEKETLAHHYEREEECLTNDLSRKLNQLHQEKCRLELTLEQEQECLVNKLMRKIEKLEAETLAKQTNLERLRREKVELENTLEQEQEALVNRLWKRMDKLEAEKRSLQIRLDQPVSDPASPSNGDTASNLSNHIQTLRSEVVKLRNQLAVSQNENKEKMHRFALEEKYIRDENVRLQRKLQQEVERREALCRHLSESESSLEMEEERQFNEAMGARSRSVSSPGGSRPLSPYSPLLPSAGLPIARHNIHFNSQARRGTSERFVKPAVPGASLLCRAGLEQPPAPPLPAAPPALPPHTPRASTPHSPLEQPASPMDTSSKD